jgi:hypothetical protein
LISDTKARCTSSRRSRRNRAASCRATAALNTNPNSADPAINSPVTVVAGNPSSAWKNIKKAAPMIRKINTNTGNSIPDRLGRTRLEAR